ncbi:B3/4 domain-containing protein [Metallosphaera hakonensis]|uniref:B3/B4 tRNA-binding domain-containing protein n=1 Tax=Metallosphaera hakonensis JCM 8857 = DSM 7519 TaxID=1293036 RepID=A0A2U9IUL3_9CREN|nr:phenylalanine--tRNA ligase beta subunit-related protein [Metallosphaera hakonensis]AWR99718.1 hypothetical protein DFR87_08475 [Metallosphaera hakonensis JCM 8857 = DSM 7519]
MRIVVDERCSTMGIFIKHTEVVGISNGFNSFEAEIRALKEKLEGEDVEKLKDNPLVKAYREFYWRIGIDPTKVRPSGEALRRRIVRTGNLPRINNIVDAGNVVSAETLISIGIYDLDQVKGEPKLTLSVGGEKFEGIGNKVEVLSQGIPIMIDEEGKVMHIFPYRDSILTSVRSATKNVLIVGGGVKGISPSLVEEAVFRVGGLLSRIGGKIVHEVQ